MPIGTQWKLVTKPSEYSYSDKTIKVKQWNGGYIEIQIGYVRQHPNELDIRLFKVWKTKGGKTESQIFNIKPDDWSDIRTNIEKLVPELGKTLTISDIDNAITKVTKETQLLELIARYPELLKTTEKVDILLLPENQKEALSRLLSVGGDIANSIIEKLSKEEVKDLKRFVELLKQMKLSTINSLVTHITGRISFINLFEKVIQNDKTYEIKGDESVHNLLKQNIWIIDRNFSVLNDNTTLKNIIYKNWGDTLLGKRGQERPDFLCMTNTYDETQDSLLIIIEIKRPSIPLTMEHFTQLISYKAILQKHTGGKIPAYKCFLIGRELDDVLQQTDLSKSGFIIKTYTDFIQEARNFYIDYKKIITSESFAF